MFGWIRKLRRRRILNRPTPDLWLAFLEDNVPAFRNMTKAQRARLIECVKIIVAERSFEGCDGLQINERMKVTIAGHASLLLLGTPNYYFDTVRAILVFPDTIQREVTHNDQGQQVGGAIESRAGEAWQSGQIVLSWPDVLYGGQEQEGFNLVIHEFAHHLDSLDGEMGGFIHFDDPDDLKRWEEVSLREYENLVTASQIGLSVLLNFYGATNRAEFFAVASETFFEQPYRFQDDYPELFDLLRIFYRVDPRQWA